MAVSAPTSLVATGISPTQIELTWLPAVIYIPGRIVIRSFTIPDYHGGGTVAYLRIHADKNFVTANGEPILKTPLGDAIFYDEITCSVAGTVITVPELTIDSTLESSDPKATYSAAILNADRAFQDPPLFKHWHIPNGPGSVFSILELAESQ